MHTNMQVFSAPGDLDDVGPASKVGEDIDAVVELQSDISIFFADPLVYNLATYILCGGLLIVWAVATLRSRASPMRAWLALAAIAPLSMLPLYHREHDAKILLLAVPACAILWAEGGARGWFALLLTYVRHGSAPAVSVETQGSGDAASRPLPV
jgi:hypothetical protein